MIFKNSKEYIAELQRRLKALQKPFELAAASTHAEMTQRIFADGKNATGGNIGSYNTTKPLYINPKDAPRKMATKGKTGKSVFKNGNKHKTAYFSNYKAFRNSQGRRIDTVDLKLTGLLRSDFASLTKSGNILYCKINNSKNVGKVQGAIKRYGRKVFMFSPKERVNFAKYFRLEKERIGVNI